MIRKILFFNYILFLFIFPVYSVEKEDREYTHLYLHPIELSEEVESTIDEFLVCNTRKVMNKHYLKISIFEANPDSVYYEIELINSPDEKKLVIDEKIFGSWYEIDFYQDSRIGHLKKTMQLKIKTKKTTKKFGGNLNYAYLCNAF